MKTLEIKKIEEDLGGGFFCVTFKNVRREIEKEDFDLDQLGSEIVFISSIQDCVMVSGEVTLKAGDSITDDFGGKPMIGANRQDAVKKDMGAAYRPTVDYRDAFKDQH